MFELYVDSFKWYTKFHQNLTNRYCYINLKIKQNGEYWINRALFQNVTEYLCSKLSVESIII